MLGGKSHNVGGPDSNSPIDSLELQTKFAEVYGPGPGDIKIFFAPGRVNLIGEHTDYNGGNVMPVAISRGIYAAVRYFDRLDKRSVRLASLNEPGLVYLDLDRPSSYLAERGWGNYPAGVIEEIRKGGSPCHFQNEGEQPFCSYLETQSNQWYADIRGCEVLFWGDLPVGAGLSSSAALEVLTAYVLLFPVFDDKVDRLWMAQLCQRAENCFVGVDCGIMDQFAVAMGKKDHAIYLNCSSLAHSYVPLNLDGFELVVMNTNRKRSLYESRYNERRKECQLALKIIREKNREAHLDNLAQASLDQVVKSFGTIENSVLARRARHVITEDARTSKARLFLSEGDVLAFGNLLVESHNSLRYDYEVSCFELDVLVDAANSMHSCAGARMTGAGFGGCAISLVRQEGLEEFKSEVGKMYYAKTGLRVEFYVCSAEDGVRCIL